VDNFEGLDRIWIDVDADVYKRWRVQSVHYEGSACMRVDYSKRDNLPWSFFAIKLGSNNLSRDISQYDRLCFYVMPETPDLKLLAKIEDNHKRAVEKRFTFNKIGKWQKCVLDFAGTDKLNLSQVILILFFAAPGEESSSGSFYIDNITLIRTKNWKPIKKFESEETDLKALAWEHFITGYAYMNNNKLTDAIREFELAIKYNPEYIRALYWEGNTYFKMSKFNKAIDCLERIIEIDPERFEVWFSLATAYKAVGDVKEASRCYEEGLKLLRDASGVSRE